MRLEPYSRLSLSLQGGKFDKPDRLFRSVTSSWRSAAFENIQDVRELIPEFYCLPEFLSNGNDFDFGSTQAGTPVHDVELPPWAQGDPRKFIMINRMALESDYVSRNLHNWIDLVFGYKQRGREAVAAQNCFVHLTYEGNIDIDALDDELEREATIAQIHNFGQTPSRLERKPHQPRQVFSVHSSEKSRDVDLTVLNNLAPLTPPFCIIGAPHRVYLKLCGQDVCKIGLLGDGSASVGDMMMVRDRLVSVGQMCCLVPPQFTKFIKFGGPTFGLSVHVGITSPRHREIEKCVSIHDNLHVDIITCVSATAAGGYVVTGCKDSSVRVWKMAKDAQSRHMQLQATLVGHDDEIACIDIASSYGIIVTGGKDGRVIVWDLKRLCYLRCLVKGRGGREDDRVGLAGCMGARSVSVNSVRVALIAQSRLNGRLRCGSIFGGGEDVTA